jgi:septal ring factor EnvC (AmiA/AmiB activator)
MKHNLYILFVLVACASLCQAKGIAFEEARQQVGIHNQRLHDIKMRIKANEDRMAQIVRQMGNVSSQGPAFNKDFKALETELKAAHTEHGQLHKQYETALQHLSTAVKQAGAKHRVVSQSGNFSVEQHDKHAGRGTASTTNMQPRIVRPGAN